MRGFKIQKTKDILSGIIAALFVIYIFYSYGLQPYFTWDTFANGRFGYIAGVPIRSIVGLMITVLGVIYLFYKKTVSRRNLYLVLFLLIVCVINTFVGGESHILGFEFLLYSTTCIYLLMDSFLEVRIYRIFYNIFVFTLIIPIIIYILVHAGIKVPYISIEAYEEIKTANWISYKIYPFASQWTHTWGPASYEMRMCGIYNEPGVVGTFCAFFLCAENFKLKGNWKNWILLVGGLFSFSVAFYVLVFIHFISKLASLRKKYFLMFFAIVFGYLVFINIPISNSDIRHVQDRLTFTEGRLKGDNRTNDRYDEIYEAMYNNDSINILFGNGRGSLPTLQQELMIDGSSYTSILYDYGIVGFVSQIIWCVAVCARYIKQHKDYEPYIWSMLFVYLANMYQRPSFFAIQYIVFLFGGIQYHILNNEKQSAITSEGNIKTC